MSGINTFLQQNKLQKSRNGTYMVAAAYILSFLLLIIGSDTFYGIITKAEKANSGEASEIGQNILQEEIIKDEEIQEEIHEEEIQEDVMQQEIMQEETSQENVMQDDALQENMEQSTRAPAGSNNIAFSNEETVELSDAGDCYWFLGYAMNEAEYDDYVRQIGMNASKNEQGNSGKEDKKEEIESFSTSEGTSKASGKNKVKYNITQEEIGMLERIVEAEATGEDMIGRILVANVVFNRMTDEEFPDTVEGVIFHKVNGDYQFSPLSDKRYWKVKVTDETREAVQRALEGEDYSKGAIYFMSRKRTKKSRARWFDDSLEWLFKHGAHEFYKDKE
jgi:N-acetylmuramoyl-L-alanine amidase